MMMPSRSNLWRHYARRRWGEPVGKILLSTGIPCPNRAAGGCVYCSPQSYRPYYLNPHEPPEGQLELGKRYLERIRVRLFLAGFQTETATAGEWSVLERYLQAVLNDPLCAGVVISTRPDYVDNGVLHRIETLTGAYPEKLALIELGLQSARPASLRRLNRRHTVEDFLDAARRITARARFALGAHLILGLPEENLADMRHSVQVVVEAGAKHLKLHHLQIVQGTPLAQEYAQAPWRLPAAEEYLEWLCALLPEIPPDIVLHRLWSTCRPDLLIAPRWDWEVNQLYARLEEMLAARHLRQGEALPVLAA